MKVAAEGKSTVKVSRKATLHLWIDPLRLWEGCEKVSSRPKVVKEEEQDTTTAEVRALK